MFVCLPYKVTFTSFEDWDMDIFAGAINQSITSIEGQFQENSLEVTI